MTDVKQALTLAESQLSPYSETARLDAEVLLAFALRQSRTFLYTHPERVLSREELIYFQKIVAKRSLGSPVAYITGIREFWSLPLEVSAETLIPRPETELLVECTLASLSNLPNTRVLDLGTGSGAIVLALAKERPNWNLYASDLSKEALSIAEHNREKLNLNNIIFFHSSWFDAIDKELRFHAIVSNPPYIAANDPHLNEGDVRFEPKMALIGGEDGLSAIRHIIHESFQRLEPEGQLIIEHGIHQENAISKMLEEAQYEDISFHRDLNGIYRVVSGKRKKMVDDKKHF